MGEETWHAARLIPTSGISGRSEDTARGSFVVSVLDAIDGFYESVVQTIKPWSAAPPKLRPDQPKPVEVDEIPNQLISTSLSSQDGVAPDAPSQKA